MILSMSSQAMLFLGTVIVGAAAGIIYDVFRLARMLLPHSRLMVQLEDALYWVIISLMAFYFLLNRNYGEIRPFAILGVFLGMTLYFLTASRVLMLVMGKVVDLLKKLFYRVLRRLLAPLRLIRKLLQPLVIKIKAIAKKHLKNVRNILHKIKKCVKIRCTKVKKEINVIFKHV